MFARGKEPGGLTIGRGVQMTTALRYHRQTTVAFERDLEPEVAMTWLLYRLACQPQAINE